MVTKEDLKKFVVIIEKTKLDNYIVVVEGKNDEEALRNLGLVETYVLKKGKNIRESIDLLVKHCKITKYDYVIILTDFDFEGKKLYKEIKNKLIQEGVKINDNLRNAVSKIEISHIEGLIKLSEKISLLLLK